MHRQGRAGAGALQLEAVALLPTWLLYTLELRAHTGDSVSFSKYAQSKLFMRRQGRECELVLALLQLEVGALLPSWLVYMLELRSRAAFEARALRMPTVQAPSVVLALTLVPLSAVGLRSLEALQAAYALWG